MIFIKKLILLLKLKWLNFCLRNLPKTTAKMWRVVVRAVEDGAGTGKLDIATNKELMREVVNIVYGKRVSKQLLMPAYLTCARHVMTEISEASARLPAKDSSTGKQYDLSAYFTIKHFYLQLIRAFNWTEKTIDTMYVEDLFDLMAVASETADKPEDEQEAYIDQIL